MQITSAKPFSRYRLSKNERKEPRVDNAAVRGRLLIISRTERKHSPVGATHRIKAHMIVGERM